MSGTLLGQCVCAVGKLEEAIILLSPRCVKSQYLVLSNVMSIFALFFSVTYSSSYVCSSFHLLFSSLVFCVVVKHSQLAKTQIANQWELLWAFYYILLCCEVFPVEFWAVEKLIFHISELVMFEIVSVCEWSIRQASRQKEKETEWKRERERERRRVRIVSKQRLRLNPLTYNICMQEHVWTHTEHAHIERKGEKKYTRSLCLQEKKWRRKMAWEKGRKTWRLLLLAHFWDQDDSWVWLINTMIQQCEPVKNNSK